MISFTCGALLRNHIPIFPMHERPLSPSPYLSPVDKTRHHRDSFWNYRGKAIYHITLATNGRRPLFGTLLGAAAEDARVQPTPLGWLAYDTLLGLPDFYRPKGYSLQLLALQIMPDHLHFVLRVLDTMPRSIGEVVRSFKSAVTSEYKRTTGDSCLWENSRAGYHEKILHHEGQLRRMIDYVKDNPRRAMIRRLHPDFMQRCLHLQIGECDYSAFGNIFLLQRARLLPVVCHRWRMKGNERDYSTPYETTAEYATELDSWLLAASEGAVLVTGGISRGEQIVKRICEEEGLPIIHLQKTPIGRYWKPEESRFNACSRGQMLILAPMAAEDLGQVDGVPASADYSVFHNLNTLVLEICSTTTPSAARL